MTYPRVISYRGASEGAEDHSPRSGQMRERHSQIALESFIFSASVWAVERKGLGREKVKQGRAVLFSRTEQRGPATPPRQCSVEASQKQEPGSPSPWSCLCCVTQIDPAARSSSVKPDRGRLPPSLPPSAAPRVGDGCFKTTTT